ncbi:MAG: type II toxin-antitoxin system VapC family toxin [Pseudomonadota bacterium]
MSTSDYLVDTNILIYHTAGLKDSVSFLGDLIARQALSVSILTKIEFLGWDKHTPEGFEKCRRLLEFANVYPVDEEVAEKTISIRRGMNIRLADAVIAATALLNNMTLATRNVDDFKKIQALEVFNPFETA